jgi:hypothetical protein
MLRFGRGAVVSASLGNRVRLIAGRGLEDCTCTILSERHWLAARRVR